MRAAQHLLPTRRKAPLGPALPVEYVVSRSQLLGSALGERHVAAEVEDEGDLLVGGQQARRIGGLEAPGDGLTRPAA